MPKRTDLQSILILGSGPIVIGQAAEFDSAVRRPCVTSATGCGEFRESLLALLENRSELGWSEIWIYYLVQKFEEVQTCLIEASDRLRLTIRQWAVYPIVKERSVPEDCIHGRTKLQRKHVVQFWKHRVSPHCAAQFKHLF